MLYSIEYEAHAVSDLEKLDKSISSRVIKKIDSMKENLFSQDIKKLKGSDLFRLRVGDYRVIFELLNGTIRILKVGHRQHIYDR